MKVAAKCRNPLIRTEKMSPKDERMREMRLSGQSSLDPEALSCIMPQVNTGDVTSEPLSDEKLLTVKENTK